MIQILKRDGTVMPFQHEKIVTAIENSMADTLDGIDSDLAIEIADEVESVLEESDVIFGVEDIQNLIEELLMDSTRKDAAKTYILYREKRNVLRAKQRPSDTGILTEDFLRKYKHAQNPMTQLGNLVYYRTYSRWLPEENRREYWWETVRRSVEYNCSLVPTTKKEAEDLYDNIFNLRQFLSGRTFWIGGTDVAKHYPMANYNCAGIVIDSYDALKDLFYALLIGTGVGVRILKEDVDKLPPIRTDQMVIHEAYNPVHKSNRKESTELSFPAQNIARINVGDSKEAWTQSLDYFFKLHYSFEYRKIDTIIMNYDSVRPRGEKLKTFGGSSSGYGALKDIIIKINKILKKNQNGKMKLRPIHCLDFANIIGEGVVVGGTRRTAEIALVDYNNIECINAKSGLYKQVDGQWIVDKNILHRQISNNSILYHEKPSREQLKWQIEQMRYSGEPGFINSEAALKRRKGFQLVNPCAEILLDSKGLCNLTTVNVFSFLNEDGVLDTESLLEAQKLSARAAYRMTCVELELPAWDIVQKRDKLLGCSLTGWQDMVNAANMTTEAQKELLISLRNAAKNEAEKYAAEIGQNKPTLVTTVKPEGTLSQLPTVSSGVHYSHSPYYVRRIRISAHDPLVKVCEELGYPVFPEVGQEVDNCITKVVEFPVKAPSGKTKYDVGAIEQLELYKMFMTYYVDHNASITVHVRNEEWEAVEEWMWNNWDEVIGISFLSLDESFYQLLPYEKISEQEFYERTALMKDFVPSLISKYEKVEEDLDIGSDGCDAGVCPIR